MSEDSTIEKIVATNDLDSEKNKSEAILTEETSGKAPENELELNEDEKRTENFLMNEVEAKQTQNVSINKDERQTENVLIEENEAEQTKNDLVSEELDNKQTEDGQKLLEDKVSELWDTERLILDAAEKEKQYLQKDMKDLNAFLADANYWNKRYIECIDHLKSATADCKVTWKEARVLITKSSDPTLTEFLEGRVSGLDLVVDKMLNRIMERAESNAQQENTITRDLIEFGLAEWRNLVLNVSLGNLIEKAIDEKLKKLSLERYKVISEWRNQSENNRKRYIAFVERQILPAVDAVEDGLRNSGVLITDSYKTDPCASKLLDSYRGLLSLLTKALEKAGIHRMDFKRGEPVNYEKHEPFAVESDLELSNEQVKDVLRTGYELKIGENQMVLRSAQVVVVKN